MPSADRTPGEDAVYVEAGRVGRAHGLDGSFYVTGARPRLLALGTLVQLANLSAPIVRRSGLPSRPIVRLEGVEDRAGADALRGQTLRVQRSEAPTLGEGEWWAHELEGLLVVDRTRSVGRVSGLIELPSCEALQVRREDGGELLVPMVRDAIRSVDVAGGRVDIDLEFLGEPWT